MWSGETKQVPGCEDAARASARGKPRPLTCRLPHHRYSHFQNESHLATLTFIILYGFGEFKENLNISILVSDKTE